VVPADLVGMGNSCGRIKIGSCPDIIAWDTDLKVIQTWQKNNCQANELKDESDLNQGNQYSI